MPDDRLAISVQHSDGRTTRWGYDEVDGKNIPNDLTFSTSIPGGFKDASCSLLRRLDQDYPDQDLFDTVTVYGPGGRVAWEGRMAQFPRSHSDSYRITPGAVGWAAHLRDDPSFSMVYIDRDLSRWGSMPTEPRIANPTWSIFDGQARPDASAGSPAMWTTVEGGQSSAKPWALAFYDAGPGNLIGELRADWQRLSISNADANYTWNMLVASDETMAVQQNTGNLRAAGPASATLTATTPYRYAAVNWFYAVAASWTQQFAIIWTNLRVFGDHGLTIQGSTAADEGLYASDMVAHAVSTAAPLLTYTTGTDGSIEPTTFAIPHAVYRDPTTAEFVISDVNKYHLYDWGVQENREFFFRQPDPDRLTWEARLGDGAHMDADGLTGEQVINGVFVAYTDAVGVQKTVGPPGGSFDATDEALADTSTANPVNSHGIPAKWDQLTLSFPTTQEGAVQIGSVYLAERSLATRRGSLTLTGLVQHPTEGKVPVWRVRAGDWIRVTDLDGENASVPRKIIETSYTHSSRSISLSLDNTVAKLDSILSRVGIATGIMTGSGF